MKKTLKFVAIFMAVFIVAVVGGVAGYFLITSNQTFYIYDLRIVEPLDGINDYIYGNEEAEYVKIDSRKVYLKSLESNYFNIGIYANTSNSTRNVKVTSSDTSVARIDTRSASGECRVVYLKEGETTISVSIGSVVDSFKLTVYNKIPSEFEVFDYDYYGRFAEYPEYINLINAYSDESVYYYDYKVNPYIDGNGNLVSDDDINNADLRVDYFDNKIFESVDLNRDTKQLVVKCIPGASTHGNTTQIIVQSYLDEDGKVGGVSKRYPIDVRVIANVPEFLQIELSTSPNFTDKAVFVDTVNMANIEDDGEILNDFDKYVRYQKTELYLSQQGEKAVYKTFFTRKVSRIYVRFRAVYTNGLVKPLVLGDELSISYSNIYAENCLNPTYYGDTYVLEPTSNAFQNGSFTISLTLNSSDGKIESTDFKFEYVDLDESHFWDFYEYNKNSKTFKYIYWDSRTKFDGAQTDANGNVTGFPDLDLDLSKFN